MDPARFGPQAMIANLWVKSFYTQILLRFLLAVFPFLCDGWDFSWFYFVFISVSYWIFFDVF